MQDQRIAEQQRNKEVSPNDRDKALMGVILSDPGPWSFDELVREFDGDHLGVESSLNELVANGLIHRCGEFHFPTRAARRVEQIGLD
jgi:DNA-binding HxlR family transcriptional regulator